MPARSRAAIAHLNALPGKPGYVTETFSRQARFFQPHNAARIDAVRDAIDSEYAGSPLFPILLTSLIEAADRVDSTTGVQMAYVKQWAPRSSKPLELRVPELLAGAGPRHPGRCGGADVRRPSPSRIESSRRSGSGTSTWRTWIRRTTSTGISPTTTCGRRWWPGTRPRPTAWPASGSTPATRPRDSAFNSKRTMPAALASVVQSVRLRPARAVLQRRVVARRWTSSRRCASGRTARGGHARLRLGSLRRGPHRHLRPLRAQGGAGEPPLQPGVAGHRRRAGAGAPGRRGGRRSDAAPVTGIAAAPDRGRRRTWWIGYNRQREQARSRRSPRPP